MIPKEPTCKICGEPATTEYGLCLEHAQVNVADEMNYILLTQKWEEQSRLDGDDQ